MGSGTARPASPPTRGASLVSPHRDFDLATGRIGTNLQSCRRCGCTVDHACIDARSPNGGCWWVESNLCSMCAPPEDCGWIPMTHVPGGLIIQTAPTHWRYDRPHNPRRCILCLVERLAVRFGFARFEED